MDNLNNQKSHNPEYADDMESAGVDTTSASVRDEHGFTPEQRKEIDAQIAEAEESLKSGKRITLEELGENVKAKIRRKYEVQSNSR